MNVLISILRTIGRFFTWITNFAHTSWDVAATFFVRRLFKLTFLIGFLAFVVWGLYKLHSNAVSFLRDWLRQHYLGLGRGEMFPALNSLADWLYNWISSLNYVFPLDETFQYATFLATVYLATLVILAVFRFFKNLFGGWL